MTDEDQVTQSSPSPFLAPTDWEDFIGQERVKENLMMKIHAAMARYEQLGPVLLVGPSGCGKTSLGSLIAGEHGLEFISLMITPNFKTNALNKILLDFAGDGGGCILLDEVHCLTKSQQHYLLSILEGGYVAHDNGKKFFFDHPITIIGATTELQMLTKPLIGRFDTQYHLDDYSEIDMAKIVERMALKVGISPITPANCLSLGRASAGTPRQAKRLVLAARDLGSMDPGPVLESENITEDGLTADHVAYLTSLKNLGRKAGLELISNHSGRPKEVIKDLEKLLVKREYIQMTGKGRELLVPGENLLRQLELKKKSKKKSLAPHNEPYKFYEVPQKSFPLPDGKLVAYDMLNVPEGQSVLLTAQGTNKGHQHD